MTRSFWTCLTALFVLQHPMPALALEKISLPMDDEERAGAWNAGCTARD